MARNASWLLKHPDVIAARAWFYAKISHEIPHSEPMPETAPEIRRKLDQAGSRFANRS